ncbi:hypothetical protein KCP69_05465 [Salmonella enterica subsp. enterica]|nr:hypothetical protein KCP69_05465 [Salmonella enterica subsp. enterica]
MDDIISLLISHSSCCERRAGVETPKHTARASGSALSPFGIGDFLLQRRHIT